jgi:hypothetical protein
MDSAQVPVVSARRKGSLTMSDARQMLPPNGIYPRFLSSEAFHPEFGYLCPTPRMRLKIRMIAIMASIGMMVGAISVVALMHREGGENDRGELALAAAAAIPTADETPAVMLPPATAVVGASGVLHAPARCQDLLGSFVDRQCESAKSRAAHSRRAPHQIASLPIGRGGVVSANEPTVHEPEAVMSDEGKALGDVTGIAEAPAAGLADSSASSTKAPTKSARKHKQATPPGDNGLSAFAADPWFGRKTHNETTPFGNSGWRTWPQPAVRGNAAMRPLIRQYPTFGSRDP